MNYFFLYKSDGTIYGAPYLGTAEEWTNTPAECAGVLGPIPDTDVTAQAAFQYPWRYLVQDGQLAEQPYFTLASTSTNGQYSVTATLNNPPATPPTSVTFTIGSWTQTATLSNNEASITVQLHPSLASYVVPVSVSATGCVGTSTTIGGTQPLPIPIQVVTPSGGTPTIGPAASVAAGWLQQFYVVNDTTIEALMTNTFTAINVLYDAVFNVILPALQQSTYTPITLSADQQNALSAIKSDVLSNLVTTLTNGYPSSATSPQMQFGSFLQNFERGAANVQAFIEALQLFA